jgi:hypothetical protein
MLYRKLQGDTAETDVLALFAGMARLRAGRAGSFLLDSLIRQGEGDDVISRRTATTPMSTGSDHHQLPSIRADLTSHRHGVG